MSATDQPHEPEETAPPPGLFGYTPPNDIDAERALLGTLMLNGDAAAEHTTNRRLTAAHFYRPAHGLVFDAIARLVAAGERPDAVTVAAELMRSGDLRIVGGAPYVHTIMAAVGGAGANAYADIVLGHAHAREQIELHTRSIQHLVNGTPPAEVRESTEAALFEQDPRYHHGASGLTHWEAFTGDVFDVAEARQRGEGFGVPTGFVDLNNLTNGWQPGQLIVVAARPALGKSALALTFARGAASAQQPVAFYSLEMTARELTARGMAGLGRVPLSNINAGNLDEHGWSRLAIARERVANLPVYIDDNPSLTVPAMLTAARRLAASRVGLGLVVVDYMQLAETARRYDSRQQHVADVSRGLKMMAKTLGVPVIALAQLNRESEHRQDKRPVLSDLRESGQIEQDADVVILIHREDAHGPEPTRPGEADLIIAKHRNGPTATITVAFQGHYQQFADMAAEHPAIGR